MCGTAGGAKIALLFSIRTRDWHLISATDINDAGEIVGDGISPNGEWAAFLLTPTATPVPEPSTFLLTGIGLIGLIG